jgi:hypothetical protein
MPTRPPSATLDSRLVTAPAPRTPPSTLASAPPAAPETPPTTKDAAAPATVQRPAAEPHEVCDGLDPNGQLASATGRAWSADVAHY